MEETPIAAPSGFVAVYKQKFIAAVCGSVVLIGLFFLCTASKTEVIVIAPEHSFQKVCSNEMFSAMHCTITRILTRGDIKAGSYKIPKIVFLPTLAYRLSHGISLQSQVKVVFPEGNTYTEMISIIQSRATTVSENMLTNARSYMGYYFPNTYFFTGNELLADKMLLRMRTEATRVHDALQEEYREKNNILIQRYSWHEIVIMASILEKEARTEDAQMIAGILWKRIEKGWPLQVDATFQVYEGKTSNEITQSDLQQDSPWNTYVHAGLPPGPISNPGEIMLRAALEPIDSEYWYYLHDAYGDVHFAKSLEDHVRNKRTYLQ